MSYRVTATAKQDRSDGFEVLTPDLESAIDVAIGIRRRQQGMLVHIQDPSGKILPISEIAGLQGRRTDRSA